MEFMHFLKLEMKEELDDLEMNKVDEVKESDDTQEIFPHEESIKEEWQNGYSVFIKEEPDENESELHTKKYNTHYTESKKEQNSSIVFKSKEEASCTQVTVAKREWIEDLPEERRGTVRHFMDYYYYLQHQHTESRPPQDSKDSKDVATVLEEEEEGSRGGRRWFECPECQYASKKRNNLRRHLLTHSVVRCPECRFETTRRDDLKRHALVAHSGAKRLFRCSDCSYETTRRDNLKNHVLKHAGAPKPFACHHCAYRTNYKSHLRRHLLTHSETKLFACHRCNYRTNYKGDLKTHALKHEGEDPQEEEEPPTGSREEFEEVEEEGKKMMYKCFVCAFETDEKNHLWKHLLAHSSSESPPNS